MVSVTSRLCRGTFGLTVSRGLVGLGLGGYEGWVPDDDSMDCIQEIHHC